MARPKIIEVDYYDFKTQLRKAIDSGQRIEKSQGDEWSAFVTENKVNEVAMVAWGKGKFISGKPAPVVINDGSSWAGYYVYSDPDEMVLKWVIAD